MVAIPLDKVNYYKVSKYANVFIFKEFYPITKNVSYYLNKSAYWLRKISLGKIIGGGGGTARAPCAPVSYAHALSYWLQNILFQVLRKTLHKSLPWWFTFNRKTNILKIGSSDPSVS